MNLRIVKTLSLATLTLGLAACGSVSLDDSATGSGASGMGGTSSQGVMDPFNPSSVLSQNRSVYFDFKSYTVSEQYGTIVSQHAQYLSANPNQEIVIEGNTDARGGSEYNLALGNRRAQSVRRNLTLLGARDAQIETISLGKEKPKAKGDSEAAYAENRRADIVYLRP